MNGYFRLKIYNTSTTLELFAPKDGGQPVNGQEIIGYLSGKNIVYDISALNKGIDQAQTKDTVVTLNMSTMKPVAEMDLIDVSADKMTVTCRLYAPSEGGERISEKEILGDLNAKGVKAGIKQDVIKELMEHPRYCEDIVIAQGLEPEDSVDGYVEYLFNTDRNQRPTLLEDGSVDFFHLNLLQPCGKGQELAILHPAYRGEDGTGVDGSLVKSREPKQASFKYGNNIHVSPDGKKLISEIDGNVALVTGTVFVNSSMEFDEVGPSTGNIEFDGNVTIKGNVGTNFEIHVKGDVIVNGVIEGAIIEAGGNIIVARGVNGMGRAKLMAGGSVIAKYLENVEVSAGGYVSSEAIMHSTVSAGGDVIVDGRKGMISGGKVTAGGQVEAKALGSEMANATIIEVGMSPQIKREIMELRNQLTEKQKTLSSIVPVLNNMAMKIKSGAQLTAEQRTYVGKLMAAQKATNEEVERITDRLNELESNFNVDMPSEVRVKGVVYPGVKICISDVSMQVKTAAKYCKFVKLRGDVKITSYD